MSVDVPPNWREDKRMRTDALCLLLAVSLLAACSSGPARVVQVTLSGATFATTGGNLFNCGSPAQPATPQLLGDQTISCFLAANGDGYTSAPSTSWQVMGCGDGNAAVVQVSCSGAPGSRDVSGTVTIAVASTCKAQELPAGAGTPFAFTALAPGAQQSSSSLSACADPNDMCTSSDACAFNQFTATVTVQNVAE
jgi:hypothetical protein